MAMFYNYLNINLPENINKDLHIGQVLPNAYSALVAKVCLQYDQLLVVLVEDFNIAYQLIKELNTYIPKKQQDVFGINIMHFPDWEILPYDSFSPHIEIISDRLATLYKLPMVQKGILIVPIVTLMHKLCPADYIYKNVLIINDKDKLQLEKFQLILDQAGYSRVPQVRNFAEYSVRGSIIDLFPMGSSLPYRIDLLDDQVDSIGIFDIETQRTIKKKNRISILPAQEFPFDSDAIKKFRSNWRERFDVNYSVSQIYQEISNGFKVPGIEYYLPMFFDSTATLFDYLPENCLIMRTENCVQAADLFSFECKSRFEKLCGNHHRPILKVEELFLNSTQLFTLIRKRKQIICNKEIINKKSANQHGYYNLNITNLPVPIDELLNNNKLRKIFCVESKGRREILLTTLTKNYPELKLEYIDHFEDFFLTKQNNEGILISHLSNGFILNNINLAIICEDDLFSNKIKTVHKKREKPINTELSIKNLMEISIGDLIVHIEHGIGRYLGLVQFDYGTTIGEYLIIEYAEQNKLYVPITNLDFIHRYSGLDVENIALHKLGTDRWSKEKKKAAAQIKDTAAQLLQIYALRKNKSGIKYDVNESNYQKFLDLFPFIDTEDQNKASLAIKMDLSNDKPMDRVVCGDVGFGKTEIAMRAAFIVVDNAKQVAVLVPTTLLAQQHYQTFIDRFADFPVNIQLLSRFVDSKKQQDVINNLANGTCDIVIGTHRLLQKDLQFKSLGLLIIDEEHKFGVEQKERFKKLRAEVDILSLTATPIPRTLNMAMSGIREISIIATPPNHRLSVKTFVREFDIEIIREAITRELQRGGQVYYVHNKISTIVQLAVTLNNMLPNAKIKIAHGQLTKKELEHIMVDFYHRKFNILVCTTIIENGIDIPNANTIIIDRADCFGLPQLHQLRGRVGRSHHQAYAFCLVPSKASLTKDALKRLEALENLDTLGVGFTLATYDLEIRGSGDLLGNQQSGYINSIGFSLYMELLERAVNYLKQNNNQDILQYDLEDFILNQHVEIDLQIPAFIPTTYIPDVHTRLVLYKSIANLTIINEIYTLIDDFQDRFGELPRELNSLLEIVKLKFYCKNIGVKKVKKTSNGFDVEFSSENKINIDQIVNLLQSNPKKFKLANNKLSYIGKFEESSEQANNKIEFIIQLLQQVAI